MSMVQKDDPQKRAKNLSAESLKEFLTPDEKKSVEAGDIFRNEDVALLAAAFAKEKVINWRCAICRAFIKELNSVEIITQHIKDFGEGKFEKCPTNRHENIFFITDGAIGFASNLVPFEKVLEEKKLSTAKHVDRDAEKSILKSGNEKTELSN